MLLQALSPHFCKKCPQSKLCPQKKTPWEGRGGKGFFVCWSKAYKNPISSNLFNSKINLLTRRENVKTQRKVKSNFPGTIVGIPFLPVPLFFCGKNVFSNFPKKCQNFKNISAHKKFVKIFYFFFSKKNFQKKTFFFKKKRKMFFFKKMKVLFIGVKKFFFSPKNNYFFQNKVSAKLSVFKNDVFWVCPTDTIGKRALPPR